MVKEVLKDTSVRRTQYGTKDKKRNSRHPKSSKKKAEQQGQPQRSIADTVIGVKYNLISIDLGTSTYSSCYCLLTSPGRVSGSQVTKIPLTNNWNQEYVGPMVAAWHNDHWYIGRELELHERKIPQQKIIRNFKLLLYDTFKHTAQAQRVTEQLDEAEKTFEELLFSVIKYIWDDVWTYVRDESHRRTQDFGQYKTLVYFSVPKLVTFGATEKIKEAAKAAGLPRVAFVYEPMCAGACIVEEMMLNPSRRMVLSNCVGSTALILDCGGGTSDSMLVKILDNFTQTVHDRIQVVGEPDGIMYGSTSVDQRFRQWLRDKWDREERGGFAATVDKLGWSSDRHVLEHATYCFQIHKEAFPRLLAGHEINIKGTKTGFPGKAIPLDEETLKSFFEETIEAIIAMARRSIRKDTKIILLSGGLSANVYFRDRLKEEFEPAIQVHRPTEEWRACPVARGALTVEHILDQSKLRALYAAGLLFVNEPFDRSVHTDALTKNGRRNGHVVKLDRWYSEAYGYDHFVVEDRIKWLMTQDSKADVRGHFMSETTEQVFQIPVDERKVEFTIIFTKKTELKDSEPLKPRGKQVSSDFDCITRTIPLSDDLVERFIRNGWQIWLSPGQDKNKKDLPVRPYLLLHCRFAVRHDNRSVEVGAHVIAPECVIFRPDGEFKEGVDKRNFHKAEWVQVWNADFDTHILDTSRSTQSDALETLMANPVTQVESERINALVRAGPSSEPFQTVEVNRVEGSVRPDRRSGSVGLTSETPVPVSTLVHAAQPSANGATKRKKGKEPFKPRTNKKHRQMAEPLSNVDMNSRVQLTNYEVPMSR